MNRPTPGPPRIGRRRELADAGALLRSHRLVTLTGPGGSGKTRLALQLAADAAQQFPDGVFWVPLQALRDAALVERAIAASLGADDRLIHHIADKRLLVLADNFEQVIDAAAVISTLLAGTPNAKVLVTSREPLQIQSEQRYQVEPLPVDDAASLFVERASAVAPDFRRSDAVAQICRRLDGLPLAIELAAARVAFLDSHEILARLDRRLPLLASRSRDAPTGQRTLRATMQWSYELLAQDEQALFGSLGVFRGSFSLEAAQFVGRASLDALESLVLKNLVRRSDNGRLSMLDTIREYAADLLDAATDAEDVYRRHAMHYLTIAEEANLNAGTIRPGGQRLDIGVIELDNFRGALAWALRSESIPLGLEIATALEQLWTLDDPNEGIRWFERLFDHTQAELAAQHLHAHALRAYGSCLGIAGHFAKAEQLWVRSLAAFEQLDDEHGQAVLLHRLGITAQWRGDLDQARALVARSDEIHKRTNDVWGQAQTTGTLGAIARDEGKDTAFQLIRESAVLAQEAGSPWRESGALAELACLALNAGRIEEGEAHARESLSIADRLRDRPARIFGVALLARVAIERGQLERAGRLWRVVEHEDTVAPLGGWRRHRDAYAERMRSADGAEFQRGYAHGRALTLEESVALALDGG